MSESHTRPASEVQLALPRLVERVEVTLARATLAVLEARGLDPQNPYASGGFATDDLIAALAPPTPIHDPTAAAEFAAGDPLGLIARFELDDVDHALVVLALVADVEPRLGRVFAFLDGDRSHLRPTLDVALRLIVGDGPSRMLQLTRFRPDGALVHLGLLERASSPVDPSGRQPLIPSSGLLQALLRSAQAPGNSAVPIQLSSDTLEELSLVWSTALAKDPRARLAIVGEDSAVRVHAARHLATAIGRELLVHSAENDDGLGRIARRDALLTEAVLVSDDATVLVGFPAPALLSSETAVAGMPWVQVPALNRASRRQAWMATLHDPALSELAADRLPLDLSGIEHTAKMALARSSAEDRPVTLDDLSRAARANSIEGLSRLATVVTPRATWSDLVLPNDVTEQLHAVVARVQDRVEILDGWGFSQRRVQVGVSALFAGASGVGKSMAAEVIAGDLGLPLWRVDLARVVSKYIGETEKNLDEVFAAAERSAAMLLFDEADALFGKRSEVQDAHDRYANLEISYLLQRMESYAGIVALSTNMLRHLDDAFARRLTFTIHFPFPDASLRARLWRASWPPEARVARDVDYLHLSRHVLSGANIGNAVVAAAHLAEREGGDVTQFHLERAVEDELSKLGWVPEPEEAA